MAAPLASLGSSLGPRPFPAHKTGSEVGISGPAASAGVKVTQQRYGLLAWGVGQGHWVGSVLPQ